MFGKIIQFSECGTFAVIETSNYKQAGILRTDRCSSPDSALLEAAKYGARNSDRPSSGYYIAIDVDSAMTKDLGLFMDLLVAYERMQGSDKPGDRITQPGALKVARKSWAAYLNHKSAANRIIAEQKQNSEKAAALALFNPDIE